MGISFIGCRAKPDFIAKIKAASDDKLARSNEVGHRLLSNARDCKHASGVSFFDMLDWIEAEQTLRASKENGVAA